MGKPNIKKGYHILQLFLEDSESNFSESIRSSRTIIESKFDKNSSFLILSCINYSTRH